MYLTGDNSGYTGTWTVGSQAIANAGAELRIGNDTYTGSLGSGDLTIQSVTGGSATVRTHLIADTTISNNITLNANTDGSTARNATFLRQGIGNITLAGSIAIGATNGAPGTQRAVIQSESGGMLSLEGAITGTGANNVVRILNNGIIRFGGSTSQTIYGELVSGNVWIFDNAGTLTLTGPSIAAVTNVHGGTFSTAHTYLRRGTVAVGTGGVDTIQNDNDMHVLNGATLSVVGNETIGSLYSQRGGIVNIASGVTLTIDDNASHLFAGAFTGSGGNLSIGANTDSQTTYLALYGTNTATGTLNIGGTGGTTSRFGGIQTANLANAIGSFTTINLGVSGGSGGYIEYVGSGETFANNINLLGGGTATTNRITANGNGALVLSGNLALSGGNSTLQITGQTGGYFNPIKNQITGAITEGANVLSLAMPSNGDDDRFGITGRWALTNAANDFSGSVTVNVGMLELAGNLGDGSEATSVLGDTNATRTITLGSNNFNGRRYDMFGSGDQQGDAGFSQGTNVLIPAGDVGTIIFNDPNAGTATFGTNISWAMPNVSTTNTSGMQLINDGTKRIIINGALALGTTGNRNIVFDGTNTLQNEWNGIIGNPTTSQTTSVIKEGAGTWRLGGANTYTGNTTINNGILEIAGGSAIADANTIAINADGGDGLFSGVAKLRVINSETIASLTGDILTEAEILVGQTLTISGDCY